MSDIKPPPLQTLETRLTRIEEMVENIHDAVTDNYAMHGKLLKDVTARLYAITARLDAIENHMKDIRLKAISP